ncbi:ankyrin repeat-containing domain protein [Camillea tinctor]|nr:ankyrin repeat-containing domain protein [Camillea tinctor]
MDIVTPPPVLTPTCAIADPAQSWKPPQTRVVRIYGLSRLFDKDFSEADHEKVARDLLNYLDRINFDEMFVLWVENFTGAIVKLALIISVQEPKYRRTLHKICAIIFFGTPHRASNAYSLDSTVSSAIKEYYIGLLTNVTPSTINDLSRHFGSVDERFSLISHMFTIIIYYQPPSPSPSAYPIILPEVSATLGLDNEIRIGIKLAYHGLRHHMTRYEQNLLQNHLTNAKIAHWDYFIHFMDVLNSAYTKSDAEFPRLLSSNISTVCFDHSRLTNWVSSDDVSAAIYAPLGVPIYGFLHIRNPASIKAFKSIDSCLQGTESMFRLVLTIADGVPFDVDDTRLFYLDLKYGDAEVYAMDNESPLRDDMAMEILSLRLRQLGRPTFILLTWVAFATRPLSVEELDLVLAIDETKPNSPSPITIRHGLAVSLIKMISETAKINLGRVFLRVSYLEMRRVLLELSSEYIGKDASPYLYLAQSCLSFLVTRIINLVKGKGASVSERVTEKPWEQVNPAQGISSNISKDVTAEMPTSQFTLAEYAARNWIIHYRSALNNNHSLELQNLEPFSSFVKDPTSFVIGSYDAALVQKLFSLDKLEDLEILYQLANYQLPLSWARRLLVRAAELGDRAVVTSLSTKIDLIEPEAVVRAIATARGNIYNILRISAQQNLKDTYEQTMVQAQLAAQILGNVTTSNSIRGELLSVTMTTPLAKETWLMDALDRAVEYGDEETVIELLAIESLKEQIAAQDDGVKWTPIHRAAYYGNKLCMSKVRKAGASLNSLSPYSHSPLFINCANGNKDEKTALLAAASHGHWETTKALLNDGTDVTTSDIHGRTPLATACAEGQLQAVKVLASHYNDEQRAEGLIEAAGNGYCEVARYLLDLGCPVNKRRVDGSSALLSAVKGGHSKVVQLLVLRGADTEYKDSDGDTAILLSTRKGMFEITKLLADCGAQLEIEGSGDMQSPLGWAIYLRCPLFVRLLLERGARMKLPTGWKHYGSLLKISEFMSVPSVTNVLLQFYAQGRHQDGLTLFEALMTAMTRGNSELLKLVLEIWFVSNTAKDISARKALTYADSRKYVDEGDPVDGTPLHTATSAGTGSKIENASLVPGKYRMLIRRAACDFFRGPSKCIEMLDLLDQYGAAPLAGDSLHITALHIATSHDVDKNVIAWLINKSRPSLHVIDTAGRLPLHLAVLRCKSWRQVKNIWDNTKDIYQKLGQVSWRPNSDRQGGTILHYAAISKSVDRIAEILTKCIENGYKSWDLINQQDLAGWTPLHWACRLPRKKVIQTLLNAGADPEARTKDNWTPYHIAVAHGMTNSEELKLLRDPGDKAKGLPDGRINDGWCDFCFLNRQSKHYHCMHEDCDNYELCFKCYMHVKQIHYADHEFRCDVQKRACSR